MTTSIYPETPHTRLAGDARSIGILFRRRQIPVNGSTPVAHMRHVAATIPGDNHYRWLDTTGHFDTSHPDVFTNDPTSFNYHDTWNTPSPYHPSGLTAHAIGTYLYLGSCEVQSGGTTGNKLDAYQSPDRGDVSLFQHGRIACDVHDQWDAAIAAGAHISWAELRVVQDSSDVPMTVNFQNRLAGGSDVVVAWSLWAYQLSPYVLTDI